MSPHPSTTALEKAMRDYMPRARIHLPSFGSMIYIISSTRRDGSTLTLNWCQQSPYLNRQLAWHHITTSHHYINTRRNANLPNCRVDPIARHFGHNHRSQFTLSSSRPQPYSYSSSHASSPTTRFQSCLALSRVPSAPTPILSVAIDPNPIR